MSRAFINEDAAGEPEHRYDLPDPESPHYAEAAAWALLEGADRGDSRSAESATGYRWGDPALASHVERILEQAAERHEGRLAQLARRYLAAAGRDATAIPGADRARAERDRHSPEPGT